MAKAKEEEGTLLPTAVEDRGAKAREEEGTLPLTTAGDCIG